MIALHSTWIFDEEQKLNADSSLIDELKSERRRITGDLQDLWTNERPAVEDVIGRYGPLVRAGLIGLRKRPVDL